MKMDEYTTRRYEQLKSAGLEFDSDLQIINAPACWTFEQKDQWTTCCSWKTLWAGTLRYRMEPEDKSDSVSRFVAQRDENGQIWIAGTLLSSPIMNRSIRELSRKIAGKADEA